MGGGIHRKIDEAPLSEQTHNVVGMKFTSTMAQ